MEKFILRIGLNMQEFIERLQWHKTCVKSIIEKIEHEKEFEYELNRYLPDLSHMVKEIFSYIENGRLNIEIDMNFLLNVLQDVVYGVEQKDTVFLLDVLKYGLLEIFDYILETIKGADNE